MFAERLTEIGVKMLDVRAEVTDNEGNLLEKYHLIENNYRAHANEKYGRIVLERFKQQSGIN